MSIVLSKVDQQELFEMLESDFGKLLGTEEIQDIYEYFFGAPDEIEEVSEK